MHPAPCTLHPAPCTLHQGETRHNHLVRFTLIMGATLALWSGTAQASCPNLATTCNSVCSTTTPRAWVCDLTNNGGTNAGSATIVTNYSAIGVFDAWGTDASGVDFCCTHQGPLCSVTLNGTPYDDDLAFTHSSLAVDLAYVTTTHCITLFATANGGNSDDYISGSNSTSSYAETLNGGSEVDTVFGNDGGDTINGNAGADLLHGGDGADVISGNEDEDTIFGESGADAIYGNDGSDTICGDACVSNAGDDDVIWGGDGKDIIAGDGGNDVIQGHAHADTICGDAGDDNISGNADGYDYLWGGDGVDAANGGLSTDQCEAESMVACELPLASRPSACPGIGP